MAKLADAQDLKSWVAKAACGFDSRPRHSEMPLEQIPCAGGEVTSEQAAFSAIQGVPTARLLVTPAARDSGTDTDRLLTSTASDFANGLD